MVDNNGIVRTRIWCLMVGVWCLLWNFGAIGPDFGPWILGNFNVPMAFWPV